MKIVHLFSVATLLLTALPLRAHHSFASEFDVHQPVTLAGTLTWIDWINPHVFIFLDVKGGDGKVMNWTAESTSPNALLRRNIRKSDFVIGATLVVKGYRARSGLPLVKEESIRFPDGREVKL